MDFQNFSNIRLGPLGERFPDSLTFWWFFRWRSKWREHDPDGGCRGRHLRAGGYASHHGIGLCTGPFPVFGAVPAGSRPLVLWPSRTYGSLLLLQKRRKFFVYSQTKDATNEVLYKFVWVRVDCQIAQSFVLISDFRVPDLLVPAVLRLLGASDDRPDVPDALQSSVHIHASISNWYVPTTLNYKWGLKCYCFDTAQAKAEIGMY